MRRPTSSTLRIVLAAGLALIVTVYGCSSPKDSDELYREAQTRQMVLDVANAFLREQYPEAFHRCPPCSTTRVPHRNTWRIDSDPQVIVQHGLND
jgi:hypothetical protein